MAPSLMPLTVPLPVFVTVYVSVRYDVGSVDDLESSYCSVGTIASLMPSFVDAVPSDPTVSHSASAVPIFMQYSQPLRLYAVAPHSLQEEGFPIMSIPS